MSHAHDRHDRAGNIAAIADVVSTHTGLVLPVNPHVLATALLLDDAVFALSETAAARACVDHVFQHIGRHLPHLGGGGADGSAEACEPTASMIDDLTAALCVCP
jgi:hypothetical protein